MGDPIHVSEAINRVVDALTVAPYTDSVTHRKGTPMTEPTIVHEPDQFSLTRRIEITYPSDTPTIQVPAAARRTDHPDKEWLLTRAVIRLGWNEPEWNGKPPKWKVSVRVYGRLIRKDGTPGVEKEAWTRSQPLRGPRDERPDAVRALQEELAARYTPTTRLVVTEEPA